MPPPVVLWYVLWKCIYSFTDLDIAHRTHTDALASGVVALFGSGGVLSSWGLSFLSLTILSTCSPNTCVDCVITRNKRSDNGALVFRGGKPVFEFLALSRDDGYWSIPGLV
jgi:hypothetical protein